MEEAKEQAPVSPSRRFFVWGSAVLGALLALVPGVPLLRAFFFPAKARTVGGPEGFVPVGEVEEFEEGVWKKVAIVADEYDAWTVIRNVTLGAAWVKRDGDHFDVFSTVCPHLGCSVDFDTKDNRFECPCHVSAFDRETGQVLFGPSPRGLDPLEYRVEQGRLFIRYRRFITGAAERHPA